jgi:hypothetical protein
MELQRSIKMYFTWLHAFTNRYAIFIRMWFAYAETLIDDINDVECCFESGRPQNRHVVINRTFTTAKP